MQHTAWDYLHLTFTETCQRGTFYAETLTMVGCMLPCTQSRKELTLVKSSVRSPGLHGRARVWSTGLPGRGQSKTVAVGQILRLAVKLKRLPQQMCVVSLEYFWNMSSVWVLSNHHDHLGWNNIGREYRRATSALISSLAMAADSHFCPSHCVRVIERPWAWGGRV